MPGRRVRTTVTTAIIWFPSAAALALIACTPLKRLPDSGIRATADPALVARGRYLVNGPAHCGACHGAPEGSSRASRAPLTGGQKLPLGPLGTIVAPNLTSDPETGIGALSDATLVRSLRFNVSREGRPLAPLMGFAGLADRDLQAIVSYLRTLPARAGVPPDDPGPLKRFLLAQVATRQRPKDPPEAAVSPSRTAEYGRYLAYSVANCHGCHTKRSTFTGAFSGPPFSGGTKLKEDAGTFVAPDLTPAGVTGELTEDQFIALFRARGRHDAASPMPWASYARMTDDDLGAIYRFLKSLPA